jgi:hypothetical protein
VVESLVAETGNSGDVDVYHYATLAALDIIVTSVFGYDLDSLSNPDQDLIIAYELLFPTKGRAASVIETISSMIPFLVNWKIFKHLPFLRQNEINIAKEKISAFCVNQIKERLEGKPSGNSKCGVCTFLPMRTDGDLTVGLKMS